MSGFHVYILRCSDGSYYSGMTSDLKLRLAEHAQGLDPASYTSLRRPVTLVWSQEFPSHDEAFRVEKQIKGWRRQKKEALIRGAIEELPGLARTRPKQAI